MMKHVFRNISASLFICVVLMPTIGQLLHSVQPERRLLFRKFERAALKSVKAEHAIVFNKTCLSEGLLPLYTFTWAHNFSVALPYIAKITVFWRIFPYV